jgi:hypothetical protein
VVAQVPDAAAPVGLDAADASRFSFLESRRAQRILPLQIATKRHERWNLRPPQTCKRPRLTHL